MVLWKKKKDARLGVEYASALQEKNEGRKHILKDLIQQNAPYAKLLVRFSDTRLCNLD
jgi:hypothetical protein